MIEQILTATFTGIGTATGLTLFEFFIKPHLKEYHKKYIEYKKYIKRLFHGRTR